MGEIIYAFCSEKHLLKVYTLHHRLFISSLALCYVVVVCSCREWEENNKLPNKQGFLGKNRKKKLHLIFFGKFFESYRNEFLV